MDEVVNIDEVRKSKKKARDKKTLRYIFIGLAGFLLIGVVANIVSPTPDQVVVAPVDPKIKMAEEYKVKAIAGIDAMIEARDCDQLFNEIRIAIDGASGKGPLAWANEEIHNYAYSSAVTAGCDMLELGK
jgi:hypothetical protein